MYFYLQSPFPVSADLFAMYLSLWSYVHFDIFKLYDLCFELRHSPFPINSYLRNFQKLKSTTALDAEKTPPSFSSTLWRSREFKVSEDDGGRKCGLCPRFNVNKIHRSILDLKRFITSS